MNTTRAIMDAKEFGIHARQKGWRLGLLVARSCELSKGGQPAQKANRTKSEYAKISLRQFAELAGLSSTTASRYYNAWENAAKDGHVPHATELEPGQEIELDTKKLPAWRTYFQEVTKYKPISEKSDEKPEIPTESEAAKEIEELKDVAVKPHKRTKPGVTEFVEFSVPTTTYKIWEKKAKALDMYVYEFARAATEAAFDRL